MLRVLESIPPLAIRLHIMMLIYAHGISSYRANYLSTRTTFNFTLAHTWRGYEVRGITLLHDLKGVMGLNSSEDMSVHVLTCRSYYCNALTPVVWKLWR